MVGGEGTPAIVDDLAEERLGIVVATLLLVQRGQVSFLFERLGMVVS